MKGIVFADLQDGRKAMINKDTGQILDIEDRYLPYLEHGNGETPPKGVKE